MEDNPDDFTCGHCGAQVKRIRGADGGWYPRNACPECLWSKHVRFGVTSQPPCGAMMRGVAFDDSHITLRCTGCGFTHRTPTDEYMMHLESQGGLAAGNMRNGLMEIYRQFPDDKIISLD